MNTQKITTFLGATTFAALTLGFALSASAATVGISVNASVGLPAITTKSDTAIDARITALNTLATRVQAMQNVSASEKSATATQVSTQIANLTTLKAKIDADTDVTTARADAKTITGNYRIYALIIPQGYVIASSDRISTIVNLMTALQVKLQARITAAQTAGTNVTALLTAMTDITAKTNQATLSAQVAESKVSLLAPDEGNATVAASNKAALLAAHADIKTATADLQAARKDIATITSGLKVKATASASATAQ
jgi:hypothetical protein